MPRLLASDGDAPRRRRAKASSVVAEAERNLVMRMLLHSPKDTFAGFVAFVAVSAIIGNALFLQTGRHPAPMFGAVVTLPASPSVAPSSPMPRPRPPAADSLPLEPTPMEYRPPVDSRPAEKAPERSAEPAAPTSRSSDPLTSLVRATTSAPSAVNPRPPAPIPVQQRESARRIAAVQRALSETGFGQLKVTGINSAETRAAIQRFEQRRNMPVTGQVSDRLIRELSVAMGRPVD